MDKTRLVKELTETQKNIIMRAVTDENYPIKKSIEDLDVIADITEIKIRLNR